ncbi:MAG: hypothetical protein ABW172_14940, partial [Candidatus Binatia bacterium]
ADEPYSLPAVAFKPYPCARQLHAGVEALLRLIQQHSIASPAIEALELSVPTAVASLVDRPSASTNRAAMLGSGQYVMAVTAMRGRMDLASFAQEFIDNNQVKSLMIKVKVKDEIELDRYFPQSWPGRVRIVLADGRSLTDEVIIPKGESDNPMSVPELEEKFLSLAAPLLGAAGANAVIGEVGALPESESLTCLLAALQLRG